MNRIAAFISVLIIIGMTLNACAKATPQTEVIATQQAEPIQSQEPESELPLDKVRVALNGPVATLDPTQSLLSPSAQVDDLISGQLFRFDAQRQPQPDLVETWELSSDGLVYTMKLHQGLKYSDGTPLKTEDVIYMWNLVKDAPATNKSLIKNVVSLESPDDLTLVWTLSSPEPDFLTFFGMHYLLVHPKEKVESDKDYFMHPVSAGPYTLKEGAPGDNILLLEENPNYVFGPMSIKQIEFLVVPDQTSRTLQLAQGDLDYVYDMTQSVRGVIAEDVRTTPHNIGGIFQLIFNMRLPVDHPLANVDVRHAISFAVDRAAISTKAFFGIATPIDSFLFTGSPEKIPVVPNGGQRDLEAAKALLANTPCKDGCAVTIMSWSDRPGMKEGAQVIKENLSEIGIEVTIELVEIGVAMEKMNQGQFEMGFVGSGGGGPSYFFLANQFLPGSFWTDKAGYNSPAMNDLFASAATTIDPQKRAEIFKEIQRLGFDEAPFIPILDRNVLNGSRIPGDLLRTMVGYEMFYVEPLGD